MTRVSLKEAYDNKDVVAQIYAIRDIAEGAEDTANNAVSTANTASEHVDALVPQVEGAVQNANDASASAQASAQTVAGYENRLSDVELRVTTAEGNIVTIQGRITALETADGQNVKLTGTQTIGGVKHFSDSPTAPTTTTGLWDDQVANGAKVKNELDNYAPMVRTSDNQTITGTKSMSNVNINYLTIPAVDGQRRIQINRSDDDLNVTPTGNNVLYPVISWNDKNGEMMGGIYLSHNINGTTSLSAITRNADKTLKYTVLVSGV